MPQITITVSDFVLRALQARAQREDVSVADLLRAAILELTDDGVDQEVRAIVDEITATYADLLDALAEGPRTYHNVDAS